MKLQQFENHISKVIVKRGKDYYENGAIYELTQISVNAWRASLLGTDQYFVYVELKDNEVAVSQCDCPFDGTCKHEVAVYFAIREALGTMPTTDYKVFFKNYKKQELVDILADLVAQDPLLQKRFASTKTKETVNTDLVVLQTKIMISQCANNYLRNQSDRSLEALFDQLHDVCDQAADGFMKVPILALELMTLCFEQLADIEEYVPTWMHEQMEEVLLVAFTEMLLHVKTNDEAITLTSWLLQRLEHNAKANLPHLFLIDGAIQLSAVSNAKYHIIDALTNYANYTNQHQLAQLLHFSLLMEVGTAQEITNFIEYPTIPVKLRNMIIDYCIGEQRFDDALKLCADGIEQPDVPSYYRTMWLRQAYRVHKELDNYAALRTIAFELALEGDLDDIECLKSLYNGELELWQDVSQDFVLILEQHKLDTYQFPYILEMLGEWERLLYYCQQRPQAILRFCQSLQPHYSQVVKQLLTQLVLEKSQHASNRSHYQELANILERLLALGYEEKANELKNYLRATYPRKTALHEVLNWI